MGASAAFLFSTDGVIVVLFVLAIWIALRPQSRAARRVLLVAGIGYLAASIYVVPLIVSRLLTIGYHRFERADVPPGKTAIVIFGAGDEMVSGWEDRMALANAVEVARVLEAWRVYKLLNPAWIVSSGGVVSREDLSEPSSTNMRDLLVRLGVPSERILLESASPDTHNSAVLAAPMLRTLGVEHVVLVTSETHMRRSMGSFRAAGITPIPAVAPDRWFQSPWRNWLKPTNHGLYFSAEVVHEFLGISYYWLRGWWR
jgi:uncharacterized SAM-binding protein YcdF (DUF218 family)